MDPSTAGSSGQDPNVPVYSGGQASTPSTVYQGGATVDGALKAYALDVFVTRNDGMLSSVELARCRQVNKGLNAAVDNPEVWKHVFARDFGRPKPSLSKAYHLLAHSSRRLLGTAQKAPPPTAPAYPSAYPRPGGPPPGPSPVAPAYPGSSSKPQAPAYPGSGPMPQAPAYPGSYGGWGYGGPPGGSYFTPADMHVVVGGPQHVNSGSAWRAAYVSQYTSNQQAGNLSTALQFQRQQSMRQPARRRSSSASSAMTVALEEVSPPDANREPAVPLSTRLADLCSSCDCSCSMSLEQAAVRGSILAVGIVCSCFAITVAERYTCLEANPPLWTGPGQYDTSPQDVCMSVPQAWAALLILLSLAAAGVFVTMLKKLVNDDLEAEHVALAAVAAVPILQLFLIYGKVEGSVESSWATVFTPLWLFSLFILAGFGTDNATEPAALIFSIWTTISIPAIMLASRWDSAGGGIHSGISYGYVLLPQWIFATGGTAAATLLIADGLGSSPTFKDTCVLFLMGLTVWLYWMGTFLAATADGQPLHPELTWHDIMWPWYLLPLSMALGACILVD
ncbi:unnamed protein product [Symbiodinium sp. KB8]|nr:unnamed protein product [Symbiodinium sp. KB8]